MTEIFADTSGWANFFVRTEPFHSDATRLMRTWHSDGSRIITTNYVLLELVALFTSPLRIPRELQIASLETIKSTEWIEIVHIDETLDQAAWKLLSNRQDKHWSLVDCASFVLMQKRKISQSFTADHHFEQAGFVSLLR